MKTYGYGLDVDIREKKLYFSNQKRVYQAKLDGTNKRTVLKNASVNDIAIDWKGLRMLWNDYAGKEIFATNLETKNTTVLLTSDDVMHIAVDSAEG